MFATCKTGQSDKAKAFNITRFYVCDMVNFMQRSLTLFMTASIVLFSMASAYSTFSSYNYTATASVPNSSSYMFVSYNTSVGNYLSTGSGVTLYEFADDVPNSGTSACTGTCATIWIPFFAKNLTLSSNLTASSFTQITRPNGSQQLVYDGHPLYSYVYDKTPFSINGNGFEGLWHVAKPVLAAPTPTTTTNTTNVTTATITTQPAPTTTPAAYTTTLPVSTQGGSNNTMYGVVAIIVIIIILVAYFAYTRMGKKAQTPQA